jgi:hypothetical protein
MKTTIISYKEVSRKEFYTLMHENNTHWTDDIEEISNSAARFDLYFHKRLHLHYILAPLVYGQNKETAYFHVNDLSEIAEGTEDTRFYIQTNIKKQH